jgi:hypothetical protein
MLAICCTTVSAPSGCKTNAPQMEPSQVQIGAILLYLLWCLVQRNYTASRKRVKVYKRKSALKQTTLHTLQQSRLESFSIILLSLVIQF